MNKNDFFSRKVNNNTIYKKLFNDNVINDSLYNKIKESFKNVISITPRISYVSQGYSYIEIQTSNV